MEKYIIGIDLGGTNCRFGLVSLNGRILKQFSVKVGDNRDHGSITKLLSQGISKLQTGKILGVGIGAPGIVDFDRRMIVSSPHYPAWHNFKLAEKLSKKCELPVVLDNDANMIALGESWIGAGKGIKNFIMITIGTGIGGGIVIDNKVFHGDNGFAGEIGHQIIQYDGQKCDCGGKGCWETLVSIEGLKKLTTKLGLENVRPRELSKIALEGNRSAKLAWKRFGSYLGAGITSLINILGIHTVIIGGGIGRGWDSFIDDTKNEIPKRLYKESTKRLVLKKAKLGDDAGILGSAATVKNYGRNFK